jgi:hypothetical protein
MSAPLPTETPQIDRRLQLGLSVLGTVALCLYWRSWKDLPHLVYDIPAGLAMCAFIAQLVCERRAALVSPRWWGHVSAMVPISIVPVGRELFHWPISGHLTDMLALAMIQGLDRRLPWWERMAYVIPLPIVLTIRLTRFDVAGHSESLNAILAGVAIYLVARCGESYADWRRKNGS